MLKRFKEHCKRPITWGKYYKLCGIMSIITMIYTIIYFIYIGLIDASGFIESIEDKFSSKKDEAE